MDTYANQVSEYLLTQSWQIALLAVIVGLITFALRNRSAHIRYLLWLIVLAKCLVPPMYSVPVAVLPERSPAEHSTHAAIQMTPIENSVVTDTSQPVTIEKAPASNQIKITVPNMVQTIVLVWLTGIFLFLLWIGGRAIRYTLWLHHRRTPLPPALDRQFRELFTGFKFRKSPKIWLAKDIAQPFVWGLFRGSVYLPSDFTGLDNPQHHRTVLVHELSHITRFDAAVNVLQILAQAIFWFHPFVWWVNKKIRQEREKCCDEMAVAHLSALPEHYIDAIVEALAAERRSAHPVPSLAIVGSVKDIEERIKTMLKPGKKFYKRPSLIIAVVLLMSAVLIVPISCTLTSRAKAETAIEQEEKPSMYLVEAALAGDLEEVKRLIAEGADVNATSPEIPEVKFTPIMAAANRGHAQVAQVLLENGAEVNATDFQGWTALYYTFWIFPGEDNEENHRERVQLVKALIASGADVNKQCQGISPLINAISTGTPRLGSIEALLDAGADIHFKDNRGLTPLYWAAFEGDRDVLDLILERGDYSDTIHLAACREDLTRVQTFLEEGMDVNTKDEFGCTPLHWAGLADSPEVAEFLISRGADVNAKDARNFTPLMGARGLPVIELLISKGADISAQEGLQGSTKLHDACSSGDIAVATFLLDKGADIHARNRMGATPLWVAAVYDQKEIVELLLEREANINALDRRRQCTPLWIAVRNGNKDTVELLIRKGANIHTSDNEGRTPLAIAKQRGHTEIVELLKKHGAIEDTAAVSPETETTSSLHEAIVAGDIDEIKRLIDEGADVNAKDESGYTALYYAIWNEDKALIELLVSKGADVNLTAEEDYPPLYYAVMNNDFDSVELLLAKGAKFDVKTFDGSTIFYHAAWMGNREIVKFFVTKGADVSTFHLAACIGDLDRVKNFIEQGTAIDTKDEHDWTALHWAASMGDVETSDFLIAKGADVQARMPYGSTPLHQAALSGNLKLIELLIAKGADVNSENRGGNTPLHNARHRDVAELLIIKGADVNAKSISHQIGWTPLQKSSSEGNKEVAELLIAKGADVNAKDNAGYTALRRAVLKRHVDIIELLKKHGAKE